MATDRVDLIDEDDAGRVLLALFEEVTDAAGTHSHKHLDKVGPRNAEERHASLTGDRTCQECLAGPRRAHHQHALGNATAQALELLGILQEGDDFLELVLGLVDPGDVSERHLVLRLVQEACTALAEAHGLPTAGLQLAHEQVEHDQQEEHRQHDGQRGGQEGTAFVLPICDLDSVLQQRLDYVVLGGPYREPWLGLTFCGGVGDLELVFAIPDLDGFDVLLILGRVDQRHKIAEGHLLTLLAIRSEELPDGQERDDQNDPQQEGPVWLLHRTSKLEYAT